MGLLDFFNKSETCDSNYDSAYLLSRGKNYEFKVLQDARFSPASLGFCRVNDVATSSLFADFALLEPNVLSWTATELKKSTSLLVDWKEKMPGKDESLARTTSSIVFAVSLYW